MKIQHLAALTLYLGTITGCDYLSGSSGPPPSYVTDWSAAVTQARSKNAPILLNFGGPW